jgi:acyl-coenzyme A thioesterase PaaI-like protein
MPTRREIIEQFIPNSPHAAQLGINVVSLGTDEAVLELPFKPELATIGEVVHGGAIGALIDTAAMAAAWATDEIPENPAALRSRSRSTSPPPRAAWTCKPRRGSPSDADG